MAFHDSRVRQEASMSLSPTALPGPVPEGEDTARRPHRRPLQWHWHYHKCPSQRGGIHYKLPHLYVAAVHVLLFTRVLLVYWCQKISTVSLARHTTGSQRSSGRDGGSSPGGVWLPWESHNIGTVGCPHERQLQGRGDGTDALCHALSQFCGRGRSW